MGSKTVLIHPDKNMRKILALNLDLYTGTEVIYLENADDLTDYFSRGGKVDLVVTVDCVGEESTVLKIVYAIRSNKMGAPVILLGANPKIAKDVTSIEPTAWKKVIKAAAKHLKVTAQQMAEKEVPDYYPISLFIFLTISSVSTKIYHLEDGMYKRIYSPDDQVDEEFIRQLILENHKTLFVPALDRLTFVNSFSSEAYQKFTAATNDRDKMALASTVYEGISNTLAVVGMSDQAVRMSMESIKFMNATIQKSVGLADLLKILESNEASYAYKHTVMAAAVAHQLIGKMEWGSKEQQEKICFISFFHDITLTSDKLCNVNSVSDYDDIKDSLKESEIDALENHAARACRLVKEYPATPIGAETIILQHHCKVNGIGFTTELAPNISPLAIVFRVVEDFVHDLLAVGSEKFDKKMTINKLVKRYNKGQYGKVSNQLSLIVLN